MLTYKGIVFDDHTEMDENGVWAYMCSACAKKYKIDDRWLDNAVPEGAICGVEGCENEAEFYFDMYEEGEMKYV